MIEHNNINPIGEAIGKDFFLGIPLLTNFRHFGSVRVVIGTPFDLATYTVESLSREIASGNTSSTEWASVYIGPAFQVTSSLHEHREKGIRVRATGNNPIFILVYIHDRYDFYLSFLVHPNNEFPDLEGYEYFALSADAYASSILLVGNHNETTVSIAPVQSVILPSDAQDVNSSMVNVSSGSTHTITINRLQTLTVTSLLDLTGTKITSDKPLTVITGNEYAQVPPTVCCPEPLYVQVPPTFNWGQVFFLAPFDGRPEANQYYKLVTSAKFTTIAYKCGTSGQGLEIERAGSGFVISSSPNSYCYLTATSPVFVVQMAPGYVEDSMGDPVIAMVPPITGHVKTSAFAIPFASYNHPYFEHFITLTVQAEHFNESQIQLDGRQLTCTWNDIFNTVSEDLVGHGCTLNIAAGSHIVSHTQADGVLSVTAYGWNRYHGDAGYAFLTNFELNTAEAPSEGMTMHARCSSILYLHFLFISS
jgi:hypothetical protein